MDFKGLVWKRLKKITFFGLKSGQDLKNRGHTPTKDFQEYPPPPGSSVSSDRRTPSSQASVKSQPSSLVIAFNY